MTALFVVRRELKALSRLPQTYGIAAAYLVISGVLFINILISSEQPDLAQYYTNIASTLLVLVPIVAMRSFAEERRSGGLDITLTWPISRTGLVVGKFAANTLFVWLLSSVIWVYFWLIGRLAAIETSRTLGGYIGLLLMAMAFNALALMVSARAGSTTSAAFLAFGLLLLLWIVDYVPGWLGQNLRTLGPAAHFEAFPRGVVYWEDAAYFLTVSFLGVVLAVSALNRERPRRTLASVARRGTALGVVLICLGGTEAFAHTVKGKFDLTSAKQNTVSDVTRKVLRQVHQPIRFTGYTEPISADATHLKELAKQYRAVGADVSVEILDPDVQPGKAHDAGVTLYGQVLVEVGDRREIIDSPSQVGLTSALHRLADGPTRTICFTIGHGERDIADKTRTGASSLAEEMRRLYYEVKPLSLAVSGAETELGQCAVAIIAGPTVPFLASEEALLDRYAQHDGRLLVMADGPGAAGEQLNQLLKRWGVTFGTGRVFDLSSLADDPGSIVSVDYASKSPPVTRLRERSLPVVLVNALPIESSGDADTDDTFHPLVRSSSKSWLEQPGPGGQTTKTKGPFTVAALIDTSRVTGTGQSTAVARTRIGVVGSAEMAANRVFDIFGNRDFMSGLIQWIGFEDDLVTAGKPPAGFYKLVLTRGQKSRLVTQGVVFPAIAVLVPLPIVFLRLRRG